MHKFGDLKGACVSDSDFKHSAERMLVALREIGLNKHINPLFPRGFVEKNSL
jgi:hypothetical protein